MATCKKGMRAQSYLFDRDKWTPTTAKRWLKSHGAKAPKVDATADYLRYRQAPPFQFKKGSFRTKTLSADMGIKAVVACPTGRGNPMPTIVALNPSQRKRRKKPAKKAVKKTRSNETMSRRRRRRTRAKTRVVYRSAPRRRRSRRRNPSRARRYARRTYSTGRGILGGIHFTSAIKDAVPMLLGAVAAKFAAKRFAEGGGELDNWTWKNYLLSLAGGTVAAIAVSAIFRGRRNMAQRIFEGALLITGYKLFTNELAPTNPTLSSWFGGFGQLPEPANEYGSIYQGNETDFVIGQDGFYRPVDESHRLPAMAGFGEVVPATASMGGFMGEVVPATASMGGFADDSSEISKEFEEAY